MQFRTQFINRRRYEIGSHVLMVICFVASANAQTTLTKAVGTVKSIRGNSLVLVVDSGGEMAVTFSDSARIVRAKPGQSDLKTATPIQISDIQIGDRVATRGQVTEGNSLAASVAIVMTQGDVAERRQQEREEWRRGIGGIVKEVNPGTETLTLANALLASGKPIVVHVAKDTALLRYAADSVRFDDAKPGTFDQIKPGDQLRARGTKNADGNEFTAAAIVSGRFRDIAGTVVSTDAANKTITVNDMTVKQPITVKVSGDSQLRKLPQMMAMALAMRLKGGAPGGGEAGPVAPGNGTLRPGSSGGGGPGVPPGNVNRREGQAGPGPNGRAGAGPPDFQQMLSRMPPVSLGDLNKGDAVMLVATQGNAESSPTAITLLAGVEPILSAAPAGTRASTILSPWNLGEPSAVQDASAPQ
ncbi:MAG: hypothetical protein JO356_01375 [Acidobacteria bacterium]|nr:hypothetical protein [Acidobacteriota bacterium]